MKKRIMILMMVATGFFCSGQSSTDSVYTGFPDSVKSNDTMTEAWRKATLAEEIESGQIYKSMSPHHNVLHEFTYLMAMRDYCDTTLSQLSAAGKSDSYRKNKKLSRKLKRKLSKAKAELASSKFNGLKIETGMYELFLKQINDRKEWQK